MRAVIAIPARYGSTRLPGKALADIGGEPMVVRVARLCGTVRSASRVVVATDDRRILEAVAARGCEAVMTGAGHASGTDRIAEALREERCDLVVNVQGDEPFLEPGVVEELIDSFAAGDAVECATVAVTVRRASDLYDPAVVKVLVGSDGNAVCFSRYPIPWRAELWSIGVDGAWRPALAPEAPCPGYLKHLGIYAYRPGFLQRLTRLEPAPGERAERLEQLRILEHGHRIRVLRTVWDSLAVDTPEDLARARARVAGAIP